MWTPSRQFSQNITIRTTTHSQTERDKYNRPKEVTNDVIILGEVVPFSSIIKRQAIGITTEEAYKIMLPPKTEIKSDAVILIEGLKSKLFKAKSIETYSTVKGAPVQIIVVYTGQKEDTQNG